MNINKVELVFSLLLSICTLFLILNISSSYAALYPEKINKITKEQSDYKTPENTIASRLSAIWSKDLQWYFDTLTRESSNKVKDTFEAAGVDFQKIFETLNPGDRAFIIDKRDYKDAVMLIGKIITEDGAILVEPALFVQEDQLWKQTNAYNSDEELASYVKIVSPEDILACELRIYPKRWIYHQIFRTEKHKKRFPAILCALGMIQDKNGNLHSVHEIDQETVRLNYIVRPIHWEKGKKLRTSIIFNNRHPNMSKNKKFNLWRKKHLPFPGDSGPIILLRFSLMETLATLEDIKPGKEFSISISGQLKDGTPFKGVTEIVLTPPKKSSPSEVQWWNKNIDFDSNSIR